MIKRRKFILTVILFFVLFAAFVAGSILLSPAQRRTADAAVASSGSVGPTLLKPVDNGREIYENASIYVSYTYPNYMYDSQSTYILKVTYSVSADRLGNMWGADTYSLSTAAVYRKDGNGVYQLYTPTQAFGLVRRYFAVGGAKYGSGKINDETDIKKDFEDTRKVTVDVPVGAKWSDFQAKGDDTTNPSNGNKSLTLTVNEPGEYKAVLWCLGYDAGPVNAQKVEYEFSYGNGANTGNASGMGSARTASGQALSAGAYTNEAITFTAMGGTELYVDGQLQSGTTATVSGEGQHFFWVEPEIGYRAQYYYYIDKTKPTLALNGVTSGGFTRGGVTASGSDNMSVASVRYSHTTGGSFPSSAETTYTGALTAAGNYRMTVTDRAGNSTSYTFTIDKTAPVLALNGVANGGFTNGSVTVSWDTSVTGASGQRTNENDRLTVTYAHSRDGTFPTDTNSTAYMNTVFSSEGNYLVKITDSAGNSTSYTFTIDKTAPVLSLNGVANGGYGKADVTAEWTDDAGGAGAQRANENDALTVKYSRAASKDFPASAETTYTGKLTAEGNYLLVISDRAGNSTKYTFTIDKTAPKLALNGVANGGFTQGNVSAEWSSTVGGAGSPLTSDGDKLTVSCERSSGGTYPSTANTPYSSELTAEGNYLIVISDRAGNSTSYMFSIDRTAPVLELEGDNGGYTNGNVSAGWDTTAGGVRTQRMNDNDVLTVLYARSDTKDFPSSADNEYAGALTAEGNYLLVISDSAGNSTAYKFTIDKTAPTLSLLGTESGGFTQNAVSSEWSASVGGKGSQLVNDGDRLSVMYARSDSGEYPTSATQAYAKALTAEGNYLLVITDRAGNSTKYTFTIDTSAPVLALDGTSDGDFTNGDVGVEWQTTIGGVGAQRTHANDALTVMYARSETKDFPAAAETAYTGTFSQEGNYLVTITDRAGNSRSYTFTIDKTAPTLEFDTVEDGGATKEDTTAIWDTTVGGVGAPRTNGKDSLVIKYDFYDGATFPETANKDYSGKFTVQGRYFVTITDRAGNSSSYTFTLDKTAPVLRVNADMVGGNSVYGGTPSVIWSDNYLSVAEVGITLAELAVTPQSMTAGEPYGVEAEYGDKLTESGVYTVTLTDDVGNESVVSFAVVGAVNSYNRDRMENSGYLKTGNYRVKIPYMKTVTVPVTGKDGKKSVYPGAWSNANTYVFASYENALRFMTEVEMEEAVTYNGNGVYTYYQINNHSATTTYGDGDGAKATMEEFYKALEKYSLAYVSEYSVPSLNSPYVGSNTVIMDSEVLAGTTQDGVQRVGGDYVFANKTYAIAFGRQTFAYDSLARLKIEQGGRTVYEGALQSGADLLKYIGSGSASGATGGVYTVTETDGLGNTLVYEVYFDRTAPTFLAKYTYYHAFTDGEGDMQSEVLSAELELSSNLQIDGNLRTLSVQKLLDNSDAIITAVVVKPDGTTLTTFDLSLLTFGAGGNFTDGGEYHVKLYDRTGNVFDYVFTIYGGAPRVQSQIRGTGDNRSITISFANANSYSSIVRFAIYRYGVRLPDGEYNETVDGKVLNTLYIEQDVWSYRFVLGGVYTVRFEDSFGNVTESEEIVFSKGLPEYTLSGVTEGGKTRKSVSLVFESSAGYEVYKDGEVMTIPANAVADGQEIEIAATEENNGTWEIKLYVKSDPNTYVTVRFTLDTVAPTAAAENEKGAPIAWNTTTQEGFRIVWSDTDVERVRYQIDNGLSKTYTAGELLTEDGVYTVTLTDDAGNSVTYSLTRDTAVKYEINFNGTNIEQDGVGYVRGGFAVVNDEWLEMSISRDGAAVETPRFNYEYVTEGVYEITLKDSVGNQTSVTVVIDKSAPTIEVRSGADEYSPVTVEVESGDVSSMTVRKDGKAYSIELADEMTFSAWGVYEITLKDMLGNARTETFTIAKIPPKAEIFSTDGEQVADGGSTNKAVYVVWDDDEATARVTLPGGLSKTYAAKTVLMDEGTYTVKITDAAKNVVTVTVTITRTIAYTIAAADGTEIEPVWLDGMLNVTRDFVVAFEAGITVQAEKGGEPFVYESGQAVSADGVYTFILKDGVGNEEKIVIKHDATPPEVIVMAGEKDTDAVTVTVDEADAVVRLTHTAAGEKYEAELTGRTEYTFADWGEYTLEISDALGNAVTKSFTIAKVPPQIDVMTTAGILVTDGASVNSSVYIECDEENVVIRYRVNNETFSHIYKEDTILSGQGVYEITATDIAGTQITITFTLDSEVLAEAWMDGEYVRTMSDHIAGREYIDFEFGEELALDCTRDGAPYSVSAQDGALRIGDEGEYILTLTDGVENVMTVTFTIDRTAPVFEISTDSDVTKDDVAVMLEDLSDVDSYKLMTDGRKANNFVLDTLNTFDSEASYQLTLADALGNTATVSFQIRRTIGYSLSIPDSFMTADAVTLTLKQTANVSAMRDGAAFGTKAENGAYTFREDGSYSVTLTDELGNAVTLTFEIRSNPYTAKFEYTIPRDSTYKLVRDGVMLAAEEYVEGDKIVVTEDGEYPLTLRRGGRTGMFTFIVDTLLPALVLNGTEYASGASIPNLKEDFTIAANKDACTIEVFYNGVSVPYSTDAQSANGRYKVVITDALGNVAEYEFQKDFTFNAGAITLFAVGGAAVVLVVLLLVRRRIKMRIR